MGAEAIVGVGKLQVPLENFPQSAGDEERADPARWALKTGGIVHGGCWEQGGAHQASAGSSNDAFPEVDRLGIVASAAKLIEGQQDTPTIFTNICRIKSSW